VVITNRLHGHILCGLLGIKHFLSDNSYGKLRACFETWTHGLSTAIWCESQEEALQRALEEVGRRPKGQEGP
jgi:pyruvyl transferase EpsO